MKSRITDGEAATILHSINRIQPPIQSSIVPTEIKLAGGNWFGIRLAKVYHNMSPQDKKTAYELLNNISDIDYHLEANFPIDHTNSELNSLITYCEQYIKTINCGPELTQLNPSYLKTKFSLARITQLGGELFDLSVPDITTYLGLILHSNLSEEQKKLYELVIIICLLPKDPKTQKRINRLRLYVKYVLKSQDTTGVGATSVGANVMGANVMGANEMGANEMGANEMGANEMGANEMGATIGGANTVDIEASHPECSNDTSLFNTGLDLLSNVAGSSIYSDSTIDTPFHAPIDTLTDAAVKASAAETIMSFKLPYPVSEPFLLQPIRYVNNTIVLLKHQLEEIKATNEIINANANELEPGTFNCQDGLSISEASKQASQYLKKLTFVQIYNDELEDLIEKETNESKKEKIRIIHYKLKYKKKEIALQTKLNACALLQLYSGDKNTPIYQVLEEKTNEMTNILNRLFIQIQDTDFSTKNAFDFSLQNGKETVTHCATLIEDFCKQRESIIIHWMKTVLSNKDDLEDVETIILKRYGRSKTEFDPTILKEIAEKVGEPCGLKFTTNIFIDAPPKRKRPQSPLPTSKKAKIQRNTQTKTQTKTKGRSRSAPPTKRTKGGRRKNKQTKKKARKIKPTKKKAKKTKKYQKK